MFLHPKQRFCCLIQEVSVLPPTSAASTEDPQTTWFLLIPRSSSTLKRSTCPTSRSCTRLVGTPKTCSSTYLPSGLLQVLWKFIPNSSEIGFYIKHNDSYKFPLKYAGVKYCNIWTGYERYLQCITLSGLSSFLLHSSQEASFLWKSVWDFPIPFQRKSVVICIRTVILETWQPLRFWQRRFRHLPSRKCSDGGEKDKSSWWQRNSKAILV